MEVLVDAVGAGETNNDHSSLFSIVSVDEVGVAPRLCNSEGTTKFPLHDDALVDRRGESTKWLIVEVVLEASLPMVETGETSQSPCLRPGVAVARFFTTPCSCDRWSGLLLLTEAGSMIQIEVLSMVAIEEVFSLGKQRKRMTTLAPSIFWSSLEKRNL